MVAARRIPMIVFLLGALGCLGCDQLTKEVARTHLSDAISTSFVFGTVELVLAENAGAFLSLGESLPAWARLIALRVVVPLAMLVLCVGLLRGSARGPLDGLALALIVGGGLGNWLDRMLNDGLVTDFVRVGIGPLRTGIFNVADVAILAGVALLLFRMNREWVDEAPS